MTYTIKQLAELFNITARTIQNKLPALYDEGFPRKLPGAKVWSRPQVDLWITTNGNTSALPDNATKAEFLNSATANLDREYGVAS